MKKEKKYLSINELIEHIKNKGIKINNERKIKDILEHNNYYYITGYKELFRNKDDSYKDNVYFEDIYNLYQFDKKLKLLFAEILFEIEQDVKTVFTNNFCNRYGYRDLDLIDPSNYDKNNMYLLDILQKLTNQITWYGSKNEAVLYYKQNYDSIPIWVLIKVITFGMTRDLIFSQEPGIKGFVAKKIVKDKSVKAIDVQNMLELLITYRNICCHDDRLISYIHSKVNIMNTPYHKHFNLKKNSKGMYIQGKKDMFAALITIKYFADKKAFKSFINKLSKLIDNYANKTNSITKEELLDYMNLPENFEKIKDL